MSEELIRLIACLRKAQDDGSDEEEEFWLDEIQKEIGKCKHENLAYPFLPEIHNIPPKKESSDEKHR